MTGSDGECGGGRGRRPGRIPRGSALSPGLRWSQCHPDSEMLEIPLARLALALIPLIAVGVISYRWSGRSGELAVATARMVVQLLAVGYVLVLLFEVDNPWVGVAVVSFMIAVSSWIAIRCRVSTQALPCRSRRREV